MSTRKVHTIFFAARSLGKVPQIFQTTILMLGITIFGFTVSGASLPVGDVVENEFETSVFESTTEENSDSAAETSRKIICRFNQRVDYPHISTSTPSSPRAVQAHGNWGNVNCNYSSAVVTTQVDKRNTLGFYVAVGIQGKRTLPPMKNLGSANRTTARYVCNGTKSNWFRAWTSIDVIGIADAPNKVHSPGVQRQCG